MRYIGKHRPGSPRRILIGDNMLVVSNLDPVVVDQLRRQWNEQIARPEPVFYLPAGVDWERRAHDPDRWPEGRG
jgi:hypothetical protein